ncbi:MAG: globin [Rickettsiales bacterium]|nr:globin [Rickettsiales bacterium]
MTTAIEQVKQSYGRCLGQDDFWGRFYEYLLKSSPKIAEKFANTDFEKQKVLVKNSLNFVIMYADDPTGRFAKGKLEHVGDIHSHNNIDIPPNMYPLWIDSLINTVRDYDPKFTPELEKEWRAVVNPAIELLKSRY